MNVYVFKITDGNPIKFDRLCNSAARLNDIDRYESILFRSILKSVKCYGRYGNRSS